MPTGYSQELINKNFNLKKWLKESIARNFGMLVCLRDSGNLSEKEIIKQLKNQTSSYHSKKKQEILEELNKINNNEISTLKNEFLKLQKDSRAHREKRVKEIQEETAKFEAARQKLHDANLKSEGEIVPNVLTLAIQQINEHIRWDGNYSYYEKPEKIETQTFEEYLINKKETLIKDLENCEKNCQEDCERNEKRLTAYLELVNFVDKHIEE